MADAPYGYVVIHEPLANAGLHLGRGLCHAWRYEGQSMPASAATWAMRSAAESYAERAREQFPESRFVVCVLLPVEAGIQQGLAFPDDPALDAAARAGAQSLRDTRPL